MHQACQLEAAVLLRNFRLSRAGLAFEERARIRCAAGLGHSPPLPGVSSPFFSAFRHGRYSMRVAGCSREALSMHSRSSSVSVQPQLPSS